MAIPVGLCQCGCGQKTSIARVTNGKRGHTKGAPVPFVFGHRKAWSERFEVSVEDRGHGTPCHIWSGSIDTGTGYPRLALPGGRQVIASRYVYERAHGALPPWPASHVDHLCRVVACVRLDHLEAVTPAENIRRGLSAALSDEQVREIRTLCAEGWVQRDIARAYGVGAQHITAIKLGQRRSAQGGAIHVAAA